MQSPPIILSFASPFAESDFAELRNDFDTSGIPLETEDRGHRGPQAGIEWLLPTAVILFIGKSYFDGILKEIGKDHYLLLKQATKGLYKRVIGPQAPELTLIGSPGKLSATRKYSLLFSLLAEADDGLGFKLLIQESASEAEYDSTIKAFLEFLDAFHSRKLTAESVEEISKIRVVGKTMLLAYNKDQGRVIPVDPMPK